MEPDYEWEVEQQHRLKEAMEDARSDVIADAILTGDCCCPEYPSSLYDAGGIVYYMDECPVHGVDAPE